MIRADDPIADFLAHDAEMEEELKKRPVCYECREHIQTEDCYVFGSKFICPDCMTENHLKSTDDYIRW